MQAWKDKYFYNFWRPIIGIRRADEDADTAPFQVLLSINLLHTALF